MHILGLLHAPDLDDGPRPELTFEGRDMVDLGDRERTRIRAREMGFVFQDFNLVPTLTAFENVMLACDYAGSSGADSEGGDAARRSTSSGWPIGTATDHPSCPAASSNGSPSPGRSSTSRGWSSPTNRPGTSTRSGRSTSSRCSDGSIASRGGHSSS